MLFSKKINFLGRYKCNTLEHLLKQKEYTDCNAWWCEPIQENEHNIFLSATETKLQVKQMFCVNFKALLK